MSGIRRSHSTKSAVELERDQAEVFVGDAKRAAFKSDFPFVRDFVSDEKAAELSIEKGSLELRGYASTWVKDRDDEWIDPAAFEKSLPAYLSKNPIILWQHDMHQPIGSMSGDPKSTYADDFGLRVLGYVPKPAPEEPDWNHLAYNKIKKGIVKTFSIGGFFTRDFVMGHQVIKEIELMEISVVSIPSNPESLFEAAAKALGGSSRRPEILQGHVKQMKQLLGVEKMTDPELVLMTGAEKAARYEEIAAVYRKAGSVPPGLMDWRELEPQVTTAKGQAAIGAADEIVAFMRKLNGGVGLVEKRGRVLSKANEGALREALGVLETAEKTIDEVATSAKALVAETRSRVDLVLKQVEGEEDDPEETEDDPAETPAETTEDAPEAGDPGDEDE